MSSLEQCTYNACQCHAQAEKYKALEQLEKRQKQNVGSLFQRSEFRHHGKRRFPPNKKQLISKDVTHRKCSNKNVNYNSILFGEAEADSKTNNFKNNPRLYENNLGSKISCDKVPGMEIPYHAVGQSQRQKINSPSPQVSQHHIVEINTRRAPLTDRDRRAITINEGRQRNDFFLKKDKNKGLDSEFFKNFTGLDQLPAKVNKTQSKKTSQQLEVNNPE